MWTLKLIKLLTINCLIFFVSVSSDEVEVTTIIEPDGTTGCPPPDFKITKNKYMTTEQPVVTFEATQLYLPQDFITSDIEVVENKNAENIENNAEEQFDTNAQKDSANYKENPFWLEDIIKNTELTKNTENQQHYTRRAKRSHHKKLEKLHFGGSHISKIINKRSNVNKKKEVMEFIPDYSEIIPNYFNENDSKVAEFTHDSSSDHGEFEKLDRVKRKSGKTTSALNRPKGSSDSKAKSSNRKQHGQIDEEGQYLPDSEEDSHSHEKEKDSEEIDESPEVSIFREVTEVRFPAEVGPLGGHRICKIKCVDGFWIGPLCASPETEEGAQLKFEPLYKRCVVDQVPVHLLLSYKNVSVTSGWDLPHGHALQAKCQDLGLYKLLGDSKLVCNNGGWVPKMPSCVPTTLLTNYSDDSPPSIRVKVAVGSAAYEPSGILAVLPGSTIHLDCMYPRRRGSPEWTWTGWFRQYLTGWSAIPDEKASRYRLSIKDIQTQDSGTYTCASPRGNTNSVSIIVTVSQCPNLSEPGSPLSLRLEGVKLGQRALYRCPLGYMLQGTANSTCLASGNWSSNAPNCIPIQCPPLFLEDPHLSLVELNTSSWGRAVFKCSWGYRLSGPNTLECETNGAWSGPIPRCRAIQCPQPIVPLNGKIDGTSGITSFGQRKYAVGALVTFSCTEGHLLMGEASIVCTESGIWSAPPPFCKSQCPYPGDPKNGLISPLKFFYDPGDILSVQCRSGFVEKGVNGAPPDHPKCLPDGNWSGTVPQCQSSSAD